MKTILKTILFHSEKGGTGKTTLSTLYAAYRAMMGDRVLLLDADGQAHATASLGLEEAPGLYDALVRGVAIEELWRRPMREVWIPDNHDPLGELLVLPGNDETYLVPVKVGWHDNPLPLLLDELDVDRVVIDSGPSGGGLMSILWDAADGVVVPTLLDPLSIQATFKTTGRAARAGVPLLGIVPNMCNLQTLLHRMLYDALVAAGGNWRIFSPITNRIEWAETSHMRTQIYAVDAPMSKARGEAMAFCRQVDAVIAGYANLPHPRPLPVDREGRRTLEEDGGVE